MRRIPWMSLVFAILLASCALISTPKPPATPMIEPSPTPSPIPTFTPTPDPNLPCGGEMPERVYLFLDCNDVRRIRTQIKMGDSEIATSWQSLRSTVDDYRRRFPITYDPDASWDVLWWGSHGNYIARDMALVYLVTGEEKYALDIIRLLELVKEGTPYREHISKLAPAGEPGLGSGGLMSHFAFGEVVFQSLLFSYFAVRDSGVLTTEQKNDFGDFFKHQAVLLEEVSAELGNRIPVDSWLNRNTPFGANAAAATLSLAFSDDPAMAELHQRVRANMEWQLGNWWETDGNWGEDVDGYGYRVLEGLLLYAETLHKSRGEDLYQLDFSGRDLHLLCEWYLKAVTPSGTTPAMNDTPHSYGDPGVFELCAYRTGNPTLHFLYEQYMWGWDHAYGRGTKGYTPFNILAWSGLVTETAVPPAYTSLAMPDVGVTVFRENWEHDSQYLLLQFTDSKVHMEHSFGEIYLFDHGPWIVGNGYHLGGESQPGQPTDQHSTLALDGRDQTNTAGDLLAFADMSQVGISSISSRSYSNMRHTRTVLWIKPWSHWIVVDDANVEDGGNHNLQLRWYVRGSGRSAEEGIWVFTRQGQGRLTIQTLTDLAPAFTRIERHYDWEEWINDAVGFMAEMAYPGKPVRLVTSLNPDLAEDPPTTVTSTDSAQGTEIFVQREDSEWLWILPRAFTDAGEVGESQIEGKAGCQITVGGNLQGYCLMLGKLLVARGQPLVTADAPIYVEVNFADGTIIIESEFDAAVMLYSPLPVNAIFENGSPIPFEIADSFFTLHVTAGRHVYTLQQK